MQMKCMVIFSSSYLTSWFTFHVGFIPFLFSFKMDKKLEILYQKVMAWSLYLSATDSVAAARYQLANQRSYL